jgi:hypothetical protein
VWATKQVTNCYPKRSHICYLLSAICYSGTTFRRVPALFLNQPKIAEIKRRLIDGEAANGDPG